jgi:hypothetical protein
LIGISQITTEVSRAMNRKECTAYTAVGLAFVWGAGSLGWNLIGLIRTMAEMAAHGIEPVIVRLVATIVVVVVGALALPLSGMLALMFLGICRARD